MINNSYIGIDGTVSGPLKLYPNNNDIVTGCISVKNNTIAICSANNTEYGLLRVKTPSTSDEANEASDSFVVTLGYLRAHFDESGNFNPGGLVTEESFNDLKTIVDDYADNFIEIEKTFGSINNQTQLINKSIEDSNKMIRENTEKIANLEEEVSDILPQNRTILYAYTEAEVSK